ncbi:MAG TPA: 50S ribosomal protein L25 [Victivallales bacterium]|nr:50S ribosomal protein L25 [Victivallales bacterium]
MAMKKTVIAIKDRAESGKSNSRRARREGKIPCVIYGRGKESKSYYVDEKVWKEIPVSDVHLVELDSSSGKINALIKDVQFDYLKGKTLHVDFQEVRMDEVVWAEVPIHGIGTPIGISQGGFLEQVLHKLEVETLPANIPAFIEVEIANLELEKAIHVSEMKLPEGVKAITPANQTVFHVLAPKAEEEVAPAEGVVEGEAAAVEPELVGGKGKAEEEGEVAEGEEKPKAKEKEKEKEKGKDKK